jgi:hypothetical protein
MYFNRKNNVSYEDLPTRFLPHALELEKQLVYIVGIVNSDYLFFFGYSWRKILILVILKKA